MKTREIEDIASMDNVPKDVFCVFVSLFNQYLVKIYSSIPSWSIDDITLTWEEALLYSIKPVLSGVL